MEFFGELFKRNKVDKNELVEQNYEVAKEVHMPKFELLANEDEFQVLRKMLEPAIKKAVREIEEKGIKSGKVLKAVIPPEFVEGMKEGEYKLMKSLDGSLLPNIVNEKNQIVKKLRVEEMEITPQDFNAVNQLSDKVLNRKLDALSDQMDVVIDLAIEIDQQLKNKTYAKVLGAIETINQAKLDAGAKRVLLPSSSVQDLQTVPSDLLVKIQPIFHYDPTDAVYKALDVN